MKKNLFLGAVLCMFLTACNIGGEKQPNNGVLNATKVTPLSSTVNMDNLSDCTLAVSLNDGDAYVDDNGIIENVTFIGGCNGNTKGISSLVKGMRVEEVIGKLQGITCGFRPTSCPDQLATALKQIKEKKN